VYYVLMDIDLYLLVCIECLVCWFVDVYGLLVKIELIIDCVMVLLG